MASETCLETPEFHEYEARVAQALAGALRWQHSDEFPIAVEIDSQSSIQRVCVDSDVPHLPWSVRRQLARSHVTLRALPPGPTCLAGSHLDLTAALVEGTAATQGDAIGELASCLPLRESICIEQNAEVCGVFPNGTRRTFRNACAACASHSVLGWVEGPCPL